MSDRTDPPEPTDPPGSPFEDGSEAELLSVNGSRTPRRLGRTGVVVGVAAAAAVGVVGAGAWGVAALLGGGGPAPASAVPADALAYLAVDLDPSASQKIEALRTLKKFPALDERLDLDAGDDLRRWLFDSMVAEAGCEGLDFDEDVDTWLGARVAVAAVLDASGDPVPVVAVQTKDEQSARSGIAALGECADESMPGLAFVGEYAVLAETQQQADDAAADATQSALAESPDFVRWTQAAGDPGIVTGYISSQAPGAMLDAAAGELSGLPGDQAGAIEEAYADFAGAAWVVRFADGAIEAEGVASGLPRFGAGATDTGRSGIEQLPDTTTLAMGMAFHDGFAAQLMDEAAASMGQGAIDALAAQVALGTGLSLPEDLDALLGDGLSVAVDGNADWAALLSGDQPPAPEQLPIGVRISGDPTRITPVLDKVVAAVERMGTQLVVAEGDGVVAVGVDQDYVEVLSGDGSLGSAASFERVVGDPGDLLGALFLDVHAGTWLEGLADAPRVGGGEEAVANLEPLAGVGVAVWQEDRVTHGRLTVATD